LLFSKRLIRSELLDHLPPDEARSNLADLARINRCFGGHAVIRRAVQRATDGHQQFSLLDIGCASGDTARVIQEAYPCARITCLDHNAVNIEGAPYPKLIADAFQLPFAPRSFDFVLCSLFLHHFGDEQVVALLSAFYRVAREALVVCDLERQLIPYMFLPATKLFFDWNRITVHDGIRSVRAAFRAPELARLAYKAGIPAAEMEVHRPAFRISLIGRVTEPVGTRR
jgi:SAM-dependent methyltransferase